MSQQTMPVGALSAAAGSLASEDILVRLQTMSAQLDAMAEELRASREAREQLRELVATLVPVARGAMDVATRELDELQPEFQAEDLTRLARTTARAVPELDALIGQLGSAGELGRELTTISGAGMAKLTDILALAEDKGYFMFAREGMSIADRVVTSFSEEDVTALGENVVVILNAVKEMTQPEVMALVKRTAVTVQEAEAPMEPPSLLELLKQMRNPQTRRGLARVMSMLNTVGEQAPSRSTAP